ncbi:MAG TPA: endonuclease/exonuclease/phosphatase family protein [Burkholderiales bacterium]|nr:endonuclease/exonuclease/phosphatase family protein [Burkholderiales bacterium]
MPRSDASLANWQAISGQLGADCLRIASYNVHGCRGTDGRSDAARIVGVIEELGCDTIGLQEVDYRLDYIALKLGMQAIPGLTLERHDGPYGNALITRRKVLDVRRLGFTYSKREPRNALDVDLDVEGETVRVIVTHLGLWPSERRYQVKKILSLLRETPIHERVVVLGDINEWLPLGRPLRWMHGLLGKAPYERSFPSRWPLFALDRAWVRPRHALLALKAHRSPLAVAASDHLPVKALVATHEAHVRALREPLRPLLRAVGDK